MQLTAGGADVLLLRLPTECIINAGFVRSAGRRTFVGQHLPSQGPQCLLGRDRYFSGTAPGSLGYPNPRCDCTIKL